MTPGEGIAIVHFINAALPQGKTMNFETMNAKQLADFMKNAHAEMTDGSTEAYRAEGAAKYHAVKAYIAAQPKPSWRQ